MGVCCIVRILNMLLGMLQCEAVLSSVTISCKEFITFNIRCRASLGLAHDRPFAVATRKPT